MDFMPEIIGGDEEIVEEVTAPEGEEEIELPELNQEEVFDIPVKPVEKPVEDKKEEKPVKTRKKRVMTDEQKDKLAVARKKALEVRREKARLKKEEKELLKLKKQQEMDQLRQSVGRQTKTQTKTPEPVIQEKHVDKEAEINPSNNGFNEYKYTQEDVDRISLNAVQNYDKIRKTRKADKVKKQKEEADKEAERQKLLRMVQTKPQAQQDYWGNCF